MRIAQILNDAAHWIFEADAIPGWPPGPDGAEMVFADITGTPEVQEGWLYNPKKGTFTPPKTPEPAAPSLDEAKAAKKAELAAAKAAILAAGFEIETSLGVKRFPLGEGTKTDLTGLNVSALVAPGSFIAGIPYHTMDDGHIFWGAEDFAAISSATLTQIMTHDIHADALARYVDTLGSVEDVQAVTYDTVLPGMSGE